MYLRSVVEPFGIKCSKKIDMYDERITASQVAGLVQQTDGADRASRGPKEGF